MRRLTLQSRLFVWLLAAILAGMAASWGAVLLLHEPGAPPMHVLARTTAARLAGNWDDLAQVDRDVELLRSETGIDFKLHREAAQLPPAVRSHRSDLVFEPGGQAFVPIVRQGQVVGALQFRTDPPRTRSLRQALFLAVALVVLTLAARSVSARVVRPLERVAGAAHRFGEGDLATRAGVDERASPEVRDVANAFDTMAIRIERIVRDQRELLAAVSHELRSPLGRARVALELARDQGARAPALERVEKNLGELDTVLGELLTVARAGLSDVRKEPTKVLEFLRGRFADVEGTSWSGDDSIEADVDPALFARAVANVLENAHHYAGAGKVDVTVSRNHGRALVRLRDHGPGLPQALIERAFEPFVRGDQARTKSSPDHNATGLGLAIVRRVLEAHGGSASIRNVEEASRVVGAEVVLELPLA